MTIKKLLVLLFIAFCAAGQVFAGGQQGGERPASTVNPGEAAGFEEFPLGDDFELGPLNVAGVYFQPVDMVPASAGLPASQADMHLEADISALENDLGYGVGDFVPNLTVRYDITKLSTGEVVEGTFMPMNASDGPHYGANVKLPGSGGAGEYRVRFMIQNPEAQGYVLHVDATTGVPGRFWGAPLVAEWTLAYAGASW
ncbi:periplasmic iron binding protein [Pillotina sp. SPG140]